MDKVTNAFECPTIKDNVNVTHKILSQFDSGPPRHPDCEHHLVNRRANIIILYITEALYLGRQLWKRIRERLYDISMKHNKNVEC